MSGHDDLEQRLPGHLKQRAPAQPAGLLDHVLRQTADLPQRRGRVTFVTFAWWGLGAAAAAVLVLVAVALGSALPGPSIPPGGHVSPPASAEQSMTTITVQSPVLEKAIMEQAAAIMGERLRALGIGSFSSAAGDDLSFTFVLPSTVDRADVDLVLSIPGAIQWLAWSEPPWPAEGDRVPDEVFPLFDAPGQILSATVEPASGSSPEGVRIKLGSVARDAIAAYTSAHVAEPAMPLAMDGTVLIAPTIQAPITGGDVIITFPEGDPMSARAFAAILASGPLPAAWTAPQEVGVHVFCEPDNCPGGRVLIEIGSTAWEAQDADGTALAPANAPVDVRILDPDTCDVLAVFEAEPGGRFVVELSATGPAKVVDAVKEVVVFPMGPSTAQSQLSNCPR